MDKRQNIQDTLDEAWFGLLSEGSGFVNVGIDSGVATVNMDGSIQIADRTFRDSVQAADFVVTGHTCSFIKKEDDKE